ncbi:MAG: AAA family ATPase [Pirellulaceae bacterium]
MHQSYFSLTKRPFAAVASLQCYQSLEGQTAALELLRRCVDRNEGLATLIGGPGLGKTALTLKLAELLGEDFKVARLGGGNFGSRRALLQAISFGLGLPFRGLDEGDLRVQLADFLERIERQFRGVVLIVDEADTLPIRLLEELRLLTNYGSGSAPVSLVLVGGMTLEERLASPYLASFNQRITARGYLESLSAEETSRFVTAQLESTKGIGGSFDAAALKEIHSLTGGVPRVINQLCDHSLMLASLSEIRKIDQGMVAEAWADLQRLPSPSRAVDIASGQSEDEMIEFGGLDDAPNSFPQTVKFSGSEKQVEAEYEEANSSEPEIELVFQNAKDPFQEPFEVEEVVFDKFASLGEEETKSPWLRVDSPQYSEIAAILLSDNFELDYEGASHNVDVVLPDYPSTDQLLDRLEQAEEISDDRDIIEIDRDFPVIAQEDDVPESLPISPPQPVASKRTYRQLFSQLRREHA